MSKGKNVQAINNNKRLKNQEKKEILPVCLRDGNHGNIRNAIAYCHFRYLSAENQMEFWDLDNDGNLTLQHLKLDFDEFARKILEVNLFCNLFAITFLTLVAIEDIFNKKLKITFSD